MHLPDLLDLEVSRKHMIQASSNARCSQRCLYGGLWRPARSIVSHFVFEGFMTIIILIAAMSSFLDATVVSWQKLTEDNAAYLLLRLIVCIIFCVELLIKVLGMGLVPYLRSTWRIFEGSVAVLRSWATSSRQGLTIEIRLLLRARIFTLLRVLSFLKLMLNVPSLRSCSQHRRTL